MKEFVFPDKKKEKKASRKNDIHSVEEEKKKWYLHKRFRSHPNAHQIIASRSSFSSFIEKKSRSFYTCIFGRLFDLYGRSRTSSRTSSPSDAVASEAGNDGVENGDYSVDDGHDDASDEAKDGHDGSADCAKDIRDTTDDGTHFWDVFGFVWFCM